MTKTRLFPCICAISPVCDADFIDKKLEKEMEELLEVVVLGRSARNAGNLKNRQPLAAMYVVSDKIGNMDNVRDILLDELNVKNAVFSSDGGDFVTYELKPQLKTLGPNIRISILLGGIRRFLAECGVAFRSVKPARRKTVQNGCRRKGSGVCGGGFACFH